MRNSRPLKASREERVSSLIDHVIDSRYRIVAPIGEGGMGWVYRAEHVKIRRPLAIKLLNPGYRNLAGVAERFEREAFAAGRLAHPNCVAVSDCGTLDDGTVYLVMELVEGVSLADEMDNFPAGMEPRRSLHIARHLLRGLGHAHRAGVIHRDIKPDNIRLVEQDGDVNFAKLLDFGIAKLIGDAIEQAGGKELTDAGLTMGTPYYMSPEQAFGKTLDGRSDLYGATVLLYEMLTGQLPFYDVDKLAVLSMHTTDDPPSFAEIAPQAEIPREVELLVRRGLAKHPDDRIATAEEYVACIDDLFRTLNQPSRPSAARAELALQHRADSRWQGVDPARPVSPGQDRAPSVEIARQADRATPLPGLSEGGQPGSPPGPLELAPTAPVHPDSEEAAALAGSMTASAMAGGADVADPMAANSTCHAPADPSQVVALGSLRADSADPHEPWPARDGFAEWLAQWGMHWRALSSGTRLTIVLSVVVVIVMAIMASGQRPEHGGQHPENGTALAIGPDADAPSADSPSELALRAASLLENEGPRRVIEFLSATSTTGDPHATLILGHAHADLDHAAKAMTAYGDSIRAAAILASDAVLRRNMSSLLSSKGRAQVDAAMGLMEIIIRTTDDRAARDQLVAMASRHERMHTRHRAFKLAESLELGDRIDRLQSYVLDLEQEPTCERRRLTVAKLRELGDKRAIPALETAVQRTGDNPRLQKPHQANRCLVVEARQAIEYLKTR
ncbi:MAG: serine/threonine protein kinase [Proteobacteria bacterium]|nr:serine/threonine protein kinase [Pseudomonadota bacterium]